MISLKRGAACLSWSLNGKKMKAVNGKISNPKKSKQTDVLNQNIVSYPKVLKTQASPITFSQNVCRKLLPCRKAEGKKWTFKIKAGKMKIKGKGNQVYFKTKKGKKKYQRLHTPDRCQRSFYF